jgi:hypothetical protein
MAPLRVRRRGDDAAYLAGSGSRAVVEPTAERGRGEDVAGGDVQMLLEVTADVVVLVAEALRLVPV